MKYVICLILLCFSALAAGADIDLSYVNKAGPEYATFKAYVDAKLNATDAYLFTPTDVAYMAKLDGDPKYCARAISLNEAYATRVEAAIANNGQPNWSADSNGSDGISSDSYLNVGGHVRDFALVMKWCQPTPAQVTRWSAIAEQAVSNVWNPTGAKWGGRSYPWSGWSINDPANNYYYSFTLATQMWAWASGSQQWSTRLTTTTWPLLAGYMATIPTGGSEEGMGYGTSHRALFGLTRLQRNLFGQDYTDAHLTNSIYYWIHGSTPDLKHFAAIGDNSRISEPTLYSYQRAIVLQAMANTQDNKAKGYGAWWLANMTPRSMVDTWNYRDGLLSSGTPSATPGDLVWNGSSTGDFFWRTSWDPHALWGAFRAGKYNQSHAHMDQGSFQLYQDTWLANDGGIWSHSGIQNLARTNNVVKFANSSGDMPQVYNSASTLAVTGTNPATGITAIANVTPAVSNAATNWQRKYELLNTALTITDDYAAKAGVTGTWQINTKAQPVVTGKTAVAGALTIQVLEPADAVLSVVNWRTTDPDFTGGGFKLNVNSAANNHYKVVMSTGGAPQPPQVCINPQPASPMCWDGSVQGGVWSQAPFPGCGWTFVANACPAKPAPHAITIKQGVDRTSRVCVLDGNRPYSTQYQPASTSGTGLGGATKIVYTQGATVCTFPNSNQTTVTYK